MHSGVDGIAVLRAAGQNLSGGKIVSGGSTITMQVIRLSRRNRRTFGEKLIEITMALRLEMTHSKKEILSMYASHAPFGGNVVGLEAAAWRYFGRSPHHLSWGEMSALAVLPNAPSLIHPGRNRELLREKRNKLIDALEQEGFISHEDAILARLEKIPDQPKDIPLLAPHLLQRYIREYPRGARLAGTTVNAGLQRQVNNLMEIHHQQLRKNGINNLAVLVLDVETGEAKAYGGNIYKPGDPELASHVDIIPSPRSPGSVMKPLLYAAALHDGTILPNSLIPDIPLQIGGYTPRNFNDEFDGAVQASSALSRSLNIPAVKILQHYKYQRFYNLVKNAGITTFNKPADHYGLSIILGGAEVNAWDLAGVYASMARTLNHQYENMGKVLQADFHPPVYINDQVFVTGSKILEGLDITSIWYTFRAMKDVARPGDEALWEKFPSANNIYWKTGTSFGYRDAWAVGVTTKFVIAVWAGNADGEGRPGLTGIQAAAPLMFDVFRLLPDAPAFSDPSFGNAFIQVCGMSGFRAGPDCEDISNMMVSVNGTRSATCPYHKKINLDKSGQYQVNSGCYPVYEMQARNWFILPPTMESFYARNHHDYAQAPPFLTGCDAVSVKKEMDIIYPDAQARIYIPIELDGQKGRTVFTVAHSNREAKIFWHIDDSYIGTTTRFHQMALEPSPGKHTLTVTDEKGETVTRWFTIMEK